MVKPFNQMLKKAFKIKHERLKLDVSLILNAFLSLSSLILKFRLILNGLNRLKKCLILNTV